LVWRKRCITQNFADAGYFMATAVGPLLEVVAGLFLSWRNWRHYGAAVACGFVAGGLFLPALAGAMPYRRKH
jgi:hypothetical protein